MILSEFGSTGIEEMFVFQALSVGNGMNPFRSAPGPISIPPHVPLCAKLSLDSESNERPMRIITYAVLITLLPLSRWAGPLRYLPSAPIFALKTQDSMTRLNVTNINGRFCGK